MSSSQTKSVDASVDFYELLGVDYKASTKAIAKAFRQKALQCHPDKVGPDDLKAAALFLQLNKAYETLTDPTIKEPYDTALKAKIAKKQRYAELDVSKRKLREELEERERASKKQRVDTDYAEQQLQDEIERLRQDGLKKLRERELQRKAMMEEVAKDRIEQQQKQQKEAEEAFEAELQQDLARTLKIKWKRKTHAFEEDDIERIFEKFGPIEFIRMSSKGSRAQVLFESIDSARAAFSSNAPELEVFEIAWAKGKEPEEVEVNERQPDPVAPAQPMRPDGRLPQQSSSIPSMRRKPTASMSFKAYEDMILKRMNEHQLGIEAGQ